MSECIVCACSYVPVESERRENAEVLLKNSCRGSSVSGIYHLHRPGLDNLPCTVSASQDRWSWTPVSWTPVSWYVRIIRKLQTKPAKVRFKVAYTRAKTFYSPSFIEGGVFECDLDRGARPMHGRRSPQSLINCHPSSAQHQGTRLTCLSTYLMMTSSLESSELHYGCAPSGTHLFGLSSIECMCNESIMHRVPPSFPPPSQNDRPRNV
ncbi:hypothetical protein IG631_11212 [Alternaria alternata]|nr:hypothetical protein IG631_11212 [Alternaria alternata]